MGARAGPGTVNSSKQMDMERIQNADRATLSFSSDPRKTQGHIKKKKKKKVMWSS
jgi:hypothetical protein